MGNCDSSNENRSKLERSKFNGEYPSNCSSTSLPTLSSSYFNQKDAQINLKKHNSTEKMNPLKNKQYLLSERIAKREDITKKYKLSKSILGDGATSLVYIGENSSRQKFAIKRIPKAKMVSRQNVLITEAELCLKLNNKNIIKYYEIYEDINFINIVMELGDTDLFEFILNSPLGAIPDDLAIDMLIQIFEAIDYLHNVENIVHCDIKPENFVIKFDKKNGNKPILKLVDFGNARRKPINKERLFNFCGTTEYMAPETIDNCGFNEKVDEWAAGVIMFNMLTGADPFSSNNDLEYQDNIKFKNIKFEYIKNESLRELNKKLLNRFMAKRITAKEALKELRQIKKNLNYNNNILDGNSKHMNTITNSISNKLSLMNMS
jgi:serine/threonine protein kinase